MYNEWRFVWLEESSDIMRYHTIGEVENAGPSTVEKTDVEKLLMSRIYLYDDKYLIEASVSVIYRMYHLKRRPVSISRSAIRQNSQKFGFVNKADNKFSWSALPSNNCNLTYKLFTERAQSIYFIQDYHGDADGRVWMVVDSQGNLGVLKLAKDCDYDEECKIWKEVWRICAFTTSFLDANALIMPFAFQACCIDGHVFFRDRKYLERRWGY
jgi:hypothetical protein